MRRTVRLLGIASLATTALFACSSAPKSGFDNSTPTPGDGTNSSGGVLGGGTGGDGGTAGMPCVPAKGNYDIPGNNCDDDGDGKVDNPPTCDGAISGSGTAEDFAKAMGICATAAKDGYGLVSAAFTRGTSGGGSPNAAQHGVLPKFGAVLKPREGAALGVLSTGYAQEFDGNGNARFGGEDPNLTPVSGGKDWNATGSLPSGFPKAAKGCMQATDVHDVVDIQLTLKAPPNSSGIKFDLNFFSSEWPAYICSRFNDGFIAYLSAKGFNNGTPDNMSFDAMKNPVSVNNGFFDRCTPSVDIGCAPMAVPSTSQCPGGTSELQGTGFGITGQWCAAYGGLGGGGGNKTSTAGGATGWLTSSAPVQAGETFTLDLVIWDTGDGILDSSVLLDNFTWAAGAVTVSTDRPR
jgi:hypothetical protein